MQESTSSQSAMTWKTIAGLATYADFAKLMKKRGYGIDELVDLFRGKLEDTRDFFRRVIEHDYEHRDVVIPYRSVLKFYYQEKQSETLKKA
jgi:hypothetical protein